VAVPCSADTVAILHWEAVDSAGCPTWPIWPVQVSWRGETMIYLIVLFVLLVLTLVTAYYGGRSWVVANAVLLFFVFWAGFEFLYLASNEMQIQNKWRKAANDFQRQLVDVRKQLEEVEFGTEENPLGRRALQHELHRLTHDRGRVWSNCQPVGVDDQTGRLTLHIESPSPHGLEVGTLLYAFEEGSIQDGARYVGKFKAVEVNPDQGTVTLEPVPQQSREWFQALTQRNFLWRLYEIMPSDRHDLLTSLSEEELRATLPAESVEEYVKDEKPAAPADPPERKIGYKQDGTRALPEEQDQVVKELYVRRLRDYALQFMNLRDQTTDLQSLIASEEGDLAAMQETLTRVEADVKSREEERDKLQQDLTKFQMESNTLDGHLAALQEQRRLLETMIADVRQENRQLAGKLTHWQLRAADEIDAATAPPTTP